MSDLPDNYDPADDISQIEWELSNRHEPPNLALLSFVRIQTYILDLQAGCAEGLLVCDGIRSMNSREIISRAIGGGK